ncbi:hypothetical protein SRABI128_05876 [Microbacterium sp. Bi128]|nr:hypothetical protein SRABI128_05876 [Microbacterium sp. Bi128]
MRLESGGQRGQAGTGDAGGTLGGDDHEDQQGNLGAKVQRRAHGVGDEQCGHGQVDGGPVEVEGVPGGDRDTHDGLGHAEVFHLRDQAGQRGFGGGRGEDQQVFAAEVLHELEDADACDRLEQAAEDHDDEQGAGDVEGAHQGRHADDGLEAGCTDHCGDRAEGSDRGQPHDHDEDAEHEGLAVTDGLEERGSLRAHLLQREADQDGGEEGRQHGNVARDDAQQEVNGAVDCRLLVRIIGGELEALARVDQVADHQADPQGERGHDHKVGERQAADLADRGGLGDGADAQHDGAEDHGRDHHLDEFDEAVAEWFEGFADLGEQQADNGTCNHGYDDCDVEVVGLVQSLALLGRSGGRCC